MDQRRDNIRLRCHSRLNCVALFIVGIGSHRKGDREETDEAEDDDGFPREIIADPLAQVFTCLVSFSQSR